MRYIITGIFLLSVCAFGYSSKGMNAYKKLCSLCHGPAFKGAAMLNSDEWDAMFANGAKKLRTLHKEFPKALKKLNSSYFKRRGKYLHKFLHNNGRDFGVVRSCDGLNCG
ncbi:MULTISPECIES: hypothetical protein [unclassified Nitratiruptor]|uniref:hypothetical protein n=1 Tax=unclassified Nitratiruptor TaxID=2624044 RepID=UPI001915F51A|nr:MULTISPECIES: hypothetical protein [unclassified Nitratiruptor]